MTTDPLPAAAQADHLTEVLRKSGALGDGHVSDVAVESSRPTILSRIIRLRLSYQGAASDAPGWLILKTGLPERKDAKFFAGPQEVAFYTQLAAIMPMRLVPRCFEAVSDPDSNDWHL